jgi:hypothetical protein
MPSDDWCHIEVSESRKRNLVRGQLPGDELPEKSLDGWSESIDVYTA